MKTNNNKIISHAVAGQISHPRIGKSYWIGFDGIPRTLPSVGSITYDIEVGDLCTGLAGDHIEPGVSIKNKDAKENMSLNHLACIGNVATIVSGDAKGETGIVTGKHGGIDHVIIYFSQDTLNKLVIGDNIQIKSRGLGLELLDYPEVTVMNIDPDFLDKLNIEETDAKMIVNVSKVIPAYLMGSGLGSDNSRTGDYDIMLHDKDKNKKFDLDNLRFGDVVAIRDHYANHGPHYKKDALTIGIIVHSDSFSAGHGPGVVVILTTDANKLEYKLDKNANIAKLIKQVK